jgi:hypothetical protein
VVDRDEAIAARDEKIAFRESSSSSATRRSPLATPPARASSAREGGRRAGGSERRIARARADDVLARKQIAELEAECARLDRALEAQERIIDYRQSMRWWVGAAVDAHAKLAWKRPDGRMSGTGSFRRSTSSSRSTTRRATCAAAWRACSSTRAPATGSC